MLGTNVVSTSDDSAVTSGVPTLTLLFKLKNLVEYSQNSGKHFPYYHQFIIKDTKEWPDEGICWVSSGRSPRTGSSVPMELGIATLPAGGSVVQLWGSLCTAAHGGFMEVSSLIKSLTIGESLNFQSLFCPKSFGGSTWMFHLSSHMVGSSDNQLPSWSSLGAHPGHLIKKYWDTIVNACSEKQWNTSFTCTTQTFLKVLAVLCHTPGKCPNGDTLLCHSSHAESLFFYIVSFVFMQVPALDFS